LIGAVLLVDGLIVSPVKPGATQALDLIEESANPGQELDLLEKEVFSKKKEKKWNWKEASEESKTEWAIVLKRYVLADMTVYELGRFFNEALTASADDKLETIEKARVKLARLQSSFEKAVLDQNTSDATAADMQKTIKSNKLTVHEKRLLADEHKREEAGFFAIEASGQDVLEKANELFAALEASSKVPKKASPSWGSIVAAPVTPSPTSYASLLNATDAEKNATEVVIQNGAQTNATALRGSNKPTSAMLQEQFEAASKTFHSDLGSFESIKSKAVTNLLALTNLLAVPA